MKVKAAIMMIWKYRYRRTAGFVVNLFTVSLQHQGTESNLRLNVGTLLCLLRNLLRTDGTWPLMYLVGLSWISCLFLTPYILKGHGVSYFLSLKPFSLPVRVFKFMVWMLLYLHTGKLEKMLLYLHVHNSKFVQILLYLHTCKLV